MPKYQVDYEIVTFDSMEIQADSELEAANVLEKKARAAIEHSNKAFNQRVEILHTYEIRED